MSLDNMEKSDPLSELNNSAALLDAKDNAPLDTLVIPQLKTSPLAGEFLITIFNINEKQSPESLNKLVIKAHKAGFTSPQAQFLALSLKANLLSLLKQDYLDCQKTFSRANAEDFADVLYSKYALDKQISVKAFFEIAEYLNILCDKTVRVTDKQSNSDNANGFSKSLKIIFKNHSGVILALLTIGILTFVALYYHSIDLQIIFKKPGDIIEFGSYYQQNAVEKDPVLWRVLAKEGNTLLLISQKGLFSRAYNDKNEDITWETSEMRRWLNTEFLNDAFSLNQQKHIVVSHLKNPDNPRFGTPGGKDTFDKIFLLSAQEAEKYFSGPEDRVAYPTLFAVLQGAHAVKGGKEYWANCSCWWLRSPGVSNTSSMYVHCYGVLFYRGGRITEHGAMGAASGPAHRPCLRISF